MAGDSKTLTIRLIGNSKGAEAAMGRTAAAADTLGARVSKIGKSFTGLGKTLKSAGSTLTHRVTLPVAAIGVVSMKMASDFDSAMLKIQTGAGGTAKDVQWLSKRVLNLAANTQQAPLELADSMFHLKSVGMSNVEAMKALAAATKLASVSGADMEATTNALAGAWRTGIKGTQSFTDTVRTLNAIAGAGNMRLSDLNEALGTGFLASAKTFGISLKSAGAALALMTDESVPANAAATRLRMAFSLLGAPTHAAEKELKKIGLTGKELGTALNKGGLVGAIGLLKKHLKGLSQVDAARTLSRAFGGGRSSAAIMTLINNFDVLKQKEQQVSKNMGKFGPSVKRQLKMPKAQFALLKSTIEVLAVKIGNKLLPIAVKMAQAFNRFLTWAEKLPAPVKKFGAVLVGLLAVAGPLLSLLGAMAMGIGALLSPVGAIIAVVVALAAAFAYAWTHSKKFRDAVVGMGQKLKAAVMPAISEISNIFKTQFIPAFKAIMPVVGPVVHFLINMLGNALMGVIKGAIQVIRGVVEVIGGVFKLVGDLIHGRWKQVWQDLLQIVKGVFNILIGAFKVWWNVGILSIFRHAFTFIIDIVKGGFKRLIGESTSGIGLIKKIIGKVYDFITWPYRKAFSFVMRFVKTAWRYIRGEFSGGIGGIRGILGRVWEVITWPFRTAMNFLHRLVSGGISRAVNLFRDFPSRVWRGLRRIGSVVRGIFSGAGSWLLNAGESILRGLLSGITNGISWVRDKLSWLTSKIPDWKGPATKDATLLHGAGRLVMQGFADGLASKFAHVRRTLGGFTQNLASAATGSNLTASQGSAALAYPGGYLRGPTGLTAVVYVTVEGNVIGEKDFAKRVTPTVRDELVKIGKRNGGNIFGN